MSVNSSSSNSSLYSPGCYDMIISRSIYTAFTLTSILLLLPASIFVLNLGFQRWKQQSSSASAESLSDFVTYNLAIMELTGMLGSTIIVCSSYTNLPAMRRVGSFIWAFPWAGQMYFPIMACVERYLAVVYPITYMRLRRVGWVRIRNISTGFIWLYSFTGMGFVILTQNYPKYSQVPSASMMVVLLIVVTFCSLSVLRVLIRPRPGEVGGVRQRVDQSKQRAFHTIMIIMGVLLLKFGGNLVCNIVGSAPNVSYSVQCVLKSTSTWFNLPNSLVLPLLFLHREGKIPGCKHNPESG